MQGAQVQSLDPEDSTCCWAIKPPCCKSWVHAPEPVLHCKRSRCSEKPAQQWRPGAANKRETTPPQTLSTSFLLQMMKSTHPQCFNLKPDDPLLLDISVDFQSLSPLLSNPKREKSWRYSAHLTAQVTAVWREGTRSVTMWFPRWGDLLQSEQTELWSQAAHISVCLLPLIAISMSSAIKWEWYWNKKSVYLVEVLKKLMS